MEYTGLFHEIHYEWGGRWSDNRISALLSPPHLKFLQIMVYHYELVTKL